MEAQANKHLVSVLSVSPHGLDEACSRLQQDKMTSNDALCGSARNRSLAEVSPVVKASLSKCVNSVKKNHSPTWFGFQHEPDLIHQ